MMLSLPRKRNKSAKPKCACSQNLFSNIIATSLDIALATELFFCSRLYILRYILLFSTPPLSRLLSCLVFSGLVVFSTCPYCFLFFSSLPFSSLSFSTVPFHFKFPKLRKVSSNLPLIRATTLPFRGPLPRARTTIITTTTTRPT